MSSNYGYGEQPENETVHELALRTKKQQAIDNSAGGWREGTSRGFDPDAVFKALSSNRKIRRVTDYNNTVRQASTAGKGVEARIARREIIQQAVKAGTYNNPSQPWNKYHRWIEDGNLRNENLQQ